MNLSKSKVLFSRNLSKAAQENISVIMGVNYVMQMGTYLDLLSMVGTYLKQVRML
jgi:hypothetical protein